jgi:hypothetical protein
MTDLSEITEEWSTWSERFLAISQYFGIKDVLLGKLQISTLQKSLRRSQKKEGEG